MKKGIRIGAAVAIAAMASATLGMG
ncbi:MAG: hypothetical protein RLZ69_1218, partial [Actinomycetota bacterium]